MADNFTLFSASVRDVTPAERDWLAGLLGSEDDPRPALAELGVDTTDVDPDAWPGFEWAFVDAAAGHGDGDVPVGPDATDWRVFAQDSGTPRHVAAVVQGLLRRYRPDQCWSMTWAETCSKLREGEFAGGGLFVTAAGVTYVDPVARLRRMADLHREGKRNPAGETPDAVATPKPPGPEEREISTVLTCSTVHVTAADAELLEAAARSAGCELIVHQYEEGFFVHCGVGGDDDVTSGALSQGARLAGWSEDFCGLLRLAVASGCKWLNLDRDGPAYADLPRHEW